MAKKNGAAKALPSKFAQKNVDWDKVFLVWGWHTRHTKTEIVRKLKDECGVEVTRQAVYNALKARDLL